jgi:hypothetical protein
MVRADQADLIYKTEEAKFDAVAADIAEKYAKGQPVLVGTTSVEKSEYLAKLLVQLQVPHEVLNAKQHAREAAIIAQAGHAGAVTVATNMAGRGTDIVLGGNPEFLADVELRSRGLDPVERREEYEAAWDGVVEEMKAQVAAEAEEVRAAGGLYVLGTERHESRRIDNQLRGRSGRQGDPGESRFYLSLGDELMRRFNGQLVESIMNRFNLPDDVPIEAGMVTKAIRSAQTQVEQQNFEIRKNVLKYDEVLNKQRTVIYDERRRVLDGEDIKEQIEHMIGDVVTAYVDGATAEGYAEDWDLEKLWSALGTLYPVGVDREKLADGDVDDLSREKLAEAVIADARRAYAAREAEIDAVIGAQGGMRELERQVLLQVMDRKWREHLYEMDYLKEGIGLRAMAQRDPLIEYQREGFDMFSAMLEGIKEETVGHLFNVRVQAAAPPAVPEPQADGATPSAVERTSPTRAVAPAAAPAAPAPAPRSPGVSGSPSSGAHSLQGGGADHRQLVVLVGGRRAAHADGADHRALMREGDAALQRHGASEVERRRATLRGLDLEVAAGPAVDGGRARLVGRDLDARDLRLVGAHEEHQRAARVDRGDDRRDSAPGRGVGRGLGGAARARVGEHRLLGDGERSRGARDRDRLVLVGRLAAGADGPDDLAVHDERDPSGEARGTVQGERAEPAAGHLLLHLAAGPDEDGGGPGLVDRDAAAGGLRAFGPAQGDELAPRVDDGDDDAVAALLGEFLGGAQHCLGAGVVDDATDPHIHWGPPRWPAGPVVVRWAAQMASSAVT